MSDVPNWILWAVGQVLVGAWLVVKEIRRVRTQVSEDIHAKLDKVEFEKEMARIRDEQQKSENRLADMLKKTESHLSEKIEFLISMMKDKK